MSLNLGPLTLHEIHAGTFALDGGAMFGIVPRVLWEKQHPPDGENRIALALRCLLIDAGDRRILVDTGMGENWKPKHRAIYRLDSAGQSLDESLARAGTKLGEITDVVLSHLHFDHAGGALRMAGDEPTPTFPNATYYVQQRNWDWATRPSAKDSGSFREQDFRALEQGRLVKLNGAHTLVPGVDIFVSDGHTPGLQLVRVRGGGRTLVFCADLVPTASHLRLSWGMAYDVEPLKVVDEKRQLLDSAMAEGWILYFEHDPKVTACTVRDDGGHAVIDRIVTL